MAHSKRKRGAQPGNKNAVKNGFYAKALNKQDRSDLKKASSLEGIDEEITLLRMSLEKAARSGDYSGIGVLLKAMTVLKKIQDSKTKLDVDRRQRVKQAVIELGRRLYDGWLNSALPVSGADINISNESKQMGCLVAKDLEIIDDKLVSTSLNYLAKLK